MGTRWIIKIDQEEQFNIALLCTIGLGLTTAALWATSRWWVGRRKRSKSKENRKTLAQSPGIRVVLLQDESTSLSNGGHGLLKGTAKGTTKWEQSKRKGDMGYYFAHHTSKKELAPEDYQMNGPKLLSKGATTPDPESSKDGPEIGESPVSSSAAQRRRAQMISSYSWEDCGEEVRLTFRQSGWEWGKVDEEEIVAEWQPRRLRLVIDSREYGLHTMDLKRLHGDVAGVRALKMRNRLVVALVKGGRGSYSKKAPWTELQEKASDHNQD